jgi:hypothetical protein
MFSHVVDLCGFWPVIIYYEPASTNITGQNHSDVIHAVAHLFYVSYFAIRLHRLLYCIILCNPTPILCSLLGYKSISNTCCTSVWFFACDYEPAYTDQGGLGREAVAARLSTGSWFGGSGGFAPLKVNDF